MQSSECVFRIVPNSCRICLVKTARQYDKEENDLKSWILEHLRIDINLDEDSYPRYLCVRCFDYLKDFANFYMLALERNHLLYQKFAKSAETKSQIDEKFCFDEEEEEIDVKPIENIMIIENVRNENDGSMDCGYTFLNDDTIKSEKYIEHSTLDSVTTKEPDQDPKKSEDPSLAEEDLLKNETECLNKSSHDNEYSNSKSDDVDKESQSCIADIVGNKEKSELNKRHAKYECETCLRSFRNERNLNDHKRVHIGLKPFQCGQCKMSYNRKVNLNVHIRETHSGEILSIACPQVGCGRVFHKKRSYESHMRRIHGVKMNDPLKNIKELSTDTLEDISNLNTVAEAETEDSDDSACSTESALGITEKVYRGKFHCERCPRRFLNEKNLSAHMRTHMGLKPFQCPHCERSYTKRVNMKIHIHEMHSENPKEYVCSFEGCGKVFTKKHSFQNHVRSNHSTKPKPTSAGKIYICEDCGQVCKTFSYLKEHRLSHGSAEDKPFKCDQCDKRFVTKRSLREHMLRHAGIKNFECPFCGLKKTTRGELRIHVNYHTKEKQWPCKLCPMVFNNSANLARHDRIVHQALRPYKCKYCELSFGKVDTLRHHEMRHTGEKPHECQYCQRRFIQLVSLKAHLKTHSKIMAAKHN